MLTPELKKEWIEKIRKSELNQIWWFQNRDSFHVMTELYSAPEEIRLDKEITMIALLESNEFIWNIHDKFRKDKEFVIELNRLNYKRNIYKGLSEELRNDVEIFNMCIDRNDEFTQFRVIPKEIKQNKELMLKLSKQADIYQNIKDVYKYDKEISKVSFDINVKNWQYFPKRMQNHLLKNKDVALKLIKNNDFYYQELPNKWQKDTDVIALFMKKDLRNYCKLALELQTMERTMEYLQYSSNSLNYYEQLSTEHKENINISYYMMSVNKEVYNFLPIMHQLNWEIMGLFAKSNHYNNINQIPMKFEKEVEDLNKFDFLKFLYPKALEAKLIRLDKENNINRELGKKFKL